MSALANKVVIVTGASSGIGYAAGLALAKEGARVACAARRTDRLDQLTTKIKKAGGHAIAVECDVAKRADVDRLASVTLDTFGPCDAIVNNAGVMPLSSMAECRVEEWDQMIDVNIKGVLYGVAAVLPTMVERKSGHIVNVSSVAGRRVFQAGAVYCGTKHAVHAITEGLRMELAQHNIRVTCIAPGLVETELSEHIANQDIKDRIQNTFRENHALQSEDIANAIVYALKVPGHVGINEMVIRPTWQEP